MCVCASVAVCCCNLCRSERCRSVPGFVSMFVVRLVGVFVQEPLVCCFSPPVCVGCVVCLRLRVCAVLVSSVASVPAGLPSAAFFWGCLGVKVGGLVWCFVSSWSAAFLFAFVCLGLSVVFA